MKNKKKRKRVVVAIASCLSAATIIVGREFVEGGQTKTERELRVASEKGVDAFSDKKKGRRRRAGHYHIIHPHHQLDPLLLLPRLLKYYCCSCSLIVVVVVVAVVLHLSRPTVQPPRQFPMFDWEI